MLVSGRVPIIKTLVNNEKNLGWLGHIGIMIG